MRYFNTSNVTIQLYCFVVNTAHKINFNTSNVTIQLVAFQNLITIIINFNTSNVTIQLPSLFANDFVSSISIHLMLLFNITILYISHVAQDFNTSNVTIQPTILSHLFYSQFRYTHYISAFL